MKISSLIAAVLFASAATTGIVYADEKAAAPKAAEAQADKAAVKPHSHVQEKTGMAQSMPDAKAEKSKAGKDQGKHYHPRDGK
ncbi:hypothetical protein AB6Q56_22905 (plasmid) [Dechloromonas sp. ARDL1]|uniref:hypothetical protein n=1 Tax=Dechloromonas sp. ARDL1 TaxID=3322121 RepID=UPI003DA787A3|nr:hypothetical protein [Methylococcales bacterium]